MLVSTDVGPCFAEPIDLCPKDHLHVTEENISFSQWSYEEFISIVPNVRGPQNTEFIITMKKGPKKTDTMRFSTDHRADLLTEALVKVALSHWVISLIL